MAAGCYEIPTKGHLSQQFIHLGFFNPRSIIPANIEEEWFERIVFPLPDYLTKDLNISGQSLDIL